MRDDSELLRAYADHQSEAAFTELVGRHFGRVHAVALRQVHGNAHLAQEVAQAVFTDLARKARPLVPHPALGAWLHRATQFEALGALRTERRRIAREQEAMAMQEPHSSDDPNSLPERLHPVLDRVLGELGEQDRSAVVLRFFENCAFAEIAVRLRVTEDAARRRVDRAIEKMRTQLLRRGVASTASALACALAGQTPADPPAALVAMISGEAIKAAGTATPAAGLIASMTSTKLVLTAAGALALVAVALGLVESRRSPLSDTTRSPSIPTESGRIAAQGTNPLPAEAGVARAASPIPQPTPTDFAGELARLQKLPDSPERAVLISTLLVAWGKAAPTEALAAIDRLGLLTTHREQYVADVLGGWAASDPVGAWEAAPKEPDASVAIGIAVNGTNLAIRNISAVLADSGNLVRALEWIAMLSDESVRNRTLIDLLPVVLRKDPRQAIRLYSALPKDGLVQVNAGLQITRALAETAPDLALEFGNAAGFGPELTVDSVFSVLGRTNQSRFAAAWLDREPSAALRDRALRSYFNLRNAAVTDMNRDEYLKRLQAAAAE